MFKRLEQLPEDKQLVVLTAWVDAIDKDLVGMGMTNAAKGEIGVNDYENFHVYAHKNGGAKHSLSKIIKFVQEEDFDEHEELINELMDILNK